MDEENQPNHNEIQAQWASVRGKVRQKIGDALFKSWFKPLSLVSFNSGKLILSVPNNFIRTMVNRRVSRFIKRKLVASK